MTQITTAALLLAFGASRLDDVQLRWKPTDDTGDVLTDAASTFKGKKIQVKPFIDDRQDKKLIGRNSEDSTPRNVTTRDDVGAWCAAQFLALLKKAGVKVVTEQADLVIGGKVTRFMVNEGDTYRGRLDLELSVRTGEGKQVWSGVVMGEAKRWGRSYKEENYMETLSDALVRVLSALVNDRKLKGAASGVGGAPGAETL